MRGAVVAGVIATLAGCRQSDPCTGKSGVCLTVEATGSGLGLFDELLVGVTDGSGNQQTGETGTVAPRIELPVRFAALLKPGTSGAVSVDVSGVRDGTVVADGVADVVIPASGRASVTVSLGSTIGGDDMAGGGDGGGAGDMTIVGPVMTPSSFDLRVDAMQLGKVVFTVQTPIDVTLGAVAIVPTVMGLDIDPTTSCMSGMMLPAHATCSVIINYAPRAPESHTVDVQVATNMGTPASRLRARSPGLIVETPPIGSPPTFRAVHAVDPVHVWAVGDNNVVYRRDGTGWLGVKGPSTNTTLLDSVWAASDLDVYVASSAINKLFRTIDRGATWAPYDAQIASAIEGITGLDADHVFVAGSAGEITVGSATSGFQNDAHPSDGLAFDGIEAFGGNVFAARSDQILLRDTAATPRWGAILDASGTVHFAQAWGSTSSDFYAVGYKTPCAVNPCGVLEHKVGGNSGMIRTIALCDQFSDVWGEMTPGGFNVYTVGLNGTLANTPNTDTWTQIATGTTAPLYGVRGASGEVYAVGANGTILHVVE